MTNETKTSIETAGELAQCTADLEAREAELATLEAKGPELKSACASDINSTKKREAYAALKAEIARVVDDVEILTERERLARVAHSETVRSEKTAALRELARGANSVTSLVAIEEKYLKVIRDARRQVEEAEAVMAAIVTAQRRKQDEVEDLAKELGVPAPGVKLQMEAVRLMANRSIAQRPDVSHLLTPITEPFVWEGGYRQMHLLLRQLHAGDSVFAAADEYLNIINRALAQENSK